MSDKPDPRTGAIKVEVDGKSWTLLCDFNALCDFTDATGEDALGFIASMEDGRDPDVRKVRHMIHCMLIQTHADATLKDAGRILSVAPAAMMQAIDAATPEVDEDDASGAVEDAALGEVQAVQS